MDFSEDAGTVTPYMQMQGQESDVLSLAFTYPKSIAGTRISPHHIWALAIVPPEACMRSMGLVCFSSHSYKVSLEFL